LERLIRFNVYNFVRAFVCSFTSASMKYHVLIGFAISAASALSLGNRQQQPLDDQGALAQAQFLVELSPGETGWVTEDQKWELKRVRNSLWFSFELN
jgi:hypothetical protein